LVLAVLAQLPTTLQVDQVGRQVWEFWCKQQAV
jgi:hypothetical protein